MFVVKENFNDLEGNHHYQKNDIFPFENTVIDKKRIEELSTTKNRLKKPLIEKKNLADLTISQLVNYTLILGIDVKTVLLNVIDSNKSKNVNSVTNK